MSSAEARLEEAVVEVKEELGLEFHRHFLELAHELSPNMQAKAQLVEATLRQKGLLPDEAEFEKWRNSVAHKSKLSDEEMGKLLPDRWEWYSKL